MRGEDKRSMTESEKTEKLNDLMNKISFALKDATLAQEFEIICNRISELEKKLDFFLTETVAGKEYRPKEELDELEKENEELKAQNEKMKCCENCRFWQHNDCILDHDYDCKRWNNMNTDDYWEVI